MKKQLFIGSTMLASLVGVHAGGLYDIAPKTEDDENSPLKWTVGVNFGIDDNVTPSAIKGSSGFEDDVTSVSAYVGTSFASITPQTTWNMLAKVGGIYYLDAPSASGANDMFGQANLSLNWEHRVSERLRFTSRSFVSYELEPDYSNGLSTDRQLDEYLLYQTDNAVGYRWSERFGTYTGFTIRGVNYGSDSSSNDRFISTLYNQLRYRSTEQTNYTLDYRYSWTDASGTASDSTNHYILLGIEHRFSANSVLAAKAGVQMRDTDNGGADGDSPFAELAIRTRVNDQFSVRAFSRYSVEDYGTSFIGSTYDTNNTLRVGINTDYIVSPQLTLHGGINYVITDMEDGRFVTGASIADLDQDIININLGFSYKIDEGMFVTGSYNWTDSEGKGGILGSAAQRTYERNRASLGMRLEF